MEGSGAGSGQNNYGSGSGSWRPKNVRIRNTEQDDSFCPFLSAQHCFKSVFTGASLFLGFLHLLRPTLVNTASFASHQIPLQWSLLSLNPGSLPEFALTVRVAIHGPYVIPFEVCYISSFPFVNFSCFGVVLNHNLLLICRTEIQVSDDQIQVVFLSTQQVCVNSLSYNLN